MIQRRATACLGLSFLLAVAVRPVAAAPALPTINTNNIITITNAPYNAVGDGVFTNTTAIQQAIAAAAAGGTTNGLSGGLVRIPAPGTYLCGPLTLANNVGLQIDGGAKLLMLPINKYPGGTTSPANFIQASSLHDVQVSGSGSIDGQGLAWWQALETNSSISRPNMMTFSACTRVLIENVTMSNSPSPFMSVKGKAGNVTIRGVTVLAPSSSAVPASHNTDAIDLAETNAVIQDCYISTGDDNVAIGSSASVSKDILITNCFFGAGHGVSIGSFTSGGVSNLTVINCNFSGTDNGIRLKSQRDRGGLIQNLNYLNLGMTNVPWPFLIYSYYEFGLGTLTGVTPSFAATNSGLGSANPMWRNITFSNITATTTGTRPPLMIWGMPEIMVSNVTFTRINLTSSSTRSPEILNADGIRFIDSHFNLSGVPNTFQLYNARIIVTNSAPNPDLVKLDGLVTNGVANALSLYNGIVTLRNTNVIDGAPLVLDGSTLTVTNHLDLSRFSSLKLVLGTNATTIDTRSNLVAGGTVNIGAGAGFTNGTYTVFSYSGNLTWNSPSFGTVPPPPYQFTWDTNTFGQVKLVAALPPSLVPPDVSWQMVGDQLQVGWPSDHIGWKLQIQTNDPGTGLGTNWITVPGSTTSNSFNLSVDPTNSSVFLRLTYP